jgi:3-hydroxyacyl-[acyl-carrier-protein] dehydratase
MLRSVLYETVQVDAAGATVRLLPESPVYRGHFPGYPITPGVCLVEMALELIAEMAGQAGHDGREAGHDGRGRLVRAKSIKFTSPVMPEADTLLRFNLAGTGENRSVEVYQGDTLCAKMSLTLA